MACWIRWPEADYLQTMNCGFWQLWLFVSFYLSWPTLCCHTSLSFPTIHFGPWNTVWLMIYPQLPLLLSGTQSFILVWKVHLSSRTSFSLSLLYSYLDRPLSSPPLSKPPYLGWTSFPEKIFFHLVLGEKLKDVTPYFITFSSSVLFHYLSLSPNTW